MHDWFEGIVRELGFRPTIVQGAWMEKNGGGADASAGYHDKGGCLDLRVWDLSGTQVEAVIHATRWGGAGSWLRDQAHGGMDSHIHLVLGSDKDLAPGAAWQWINYLNGGDGLTSGGRDYHPRPSPVVQVPPDSLFGDWIDMATKEELTALLTNQVVEPLRDSIRKFAAINAQRDKADRAELRTILADIRGEQDNDARAKQVDRALKKLDQIEANTATEETV